MIGQTLSHYRITAPLGQGGMGVVYKAEDTRLGRPVAIKLLADHLARDPEAIERFEREARAASRLSHPHICAVHDVGADAGRHFIVMEFLDGAPLDRQIDGTPLPAARIVALGIEMADALEAAHTAGVLHRDVKPANVFITTRGHAKLLDFGLVKPVAAGPTAASTQADLTRAGDVVGTLAFMSPEQVRGEALDARSDLFSLGAVLYQMSTGRQPFAGVTSGMVQDAILNRQPAPIGRLNPEIPAALESILAKALEKDRGLRYQSAADLRADLLRVQRELGTAAATQAGSLAAVPRARHARRWTWAALAAAVVAVGAAVWSMAPAAGIDSVAVLPFANSGGSSDTAYLSDGLTESLIDSLSQIPGVSVSGRGAAFRYRDADAEAAGRALGVRAVLTGRLVQRGDLLIVRTDLMDVVTGSHVWGREFQRGSRDLLALQEELTREISAQLRPRLSAAEQDRVASTPTASADAYEAYLRGLHQWHKRSPEGSMRAREFFQQAIDADPAYALAHAGLADAYNNLAFFHVRPPREAVPAAKSAAARALQLDHRLANAHASLAFASLTFDWDYATATEHIERAITLDAGMRHHVVYPFYLTLGRQHDEAIAAARRTVESDPLSPSASHTLAVQLALAGRYEAAIEECRRTIRLDPMFGVAHEVLAATLAGLGQTTEALAPAERAVELSPGNLISLAVLGHVYGRAGNGPEARRVLGRLDAEAARGRYVPAHTYALVHTGLGDADRAFEWLERSFEERFNRLAYLRFEIIWDSLRKDPRFEAMVRKIGLP
jgi:serine/threonine-protein kinase